jgi:hypothetical protein
MMRSSSFIVLRNIYLCISRDAQNPNVLPTRIYAIISIIVTGNHDIRHIAGRPWSSGQQYKLEQTIYRERESVLVFRIFVSWLYFIKKGGDIETENLLPPLDLKTSIKVFFLNTSKKTLPIMFDFALPIKYIIGRV